MYSVPLIISSPGGKRDEKLILPTNSSLSVTLNRNEVSAKAVDVCDDEPSGLPAQHKTKPQKIHQHSLHHG